MSPVVDLVKTAELIVAEADRTQIPRLLNALGGLDLGLIHRTLTFLSDTKALFAAAERNVARAEANGGQVDPEAVASEITQLLSRVATMSPATQETAQ